MKTAADFLDDLRREYDLPSDYAAAAQLGLKRQQVSTYRTGKHTFDHNVATRVAEMLDIEPGYVMACMEAQRAKTPGVRKTWEKAAKVLAGTAVALLLGCISAGPFDITIPARTAAGENIHYAKSAILILAAFLLLLGHGRPRARASAVVW